MKQDLLNGKAARELSKIIPFENLFAYRALYQLLKKIPLDRYKVPPDNELEKIRKSLISLHKKSWLTSDDFIFLRDELYKRLESSRPFKELIEKTAFAKRGAPKDPSLDVLIFAITFDLKLYSEKPHYDLVADFLDEENIKHSLSADELRKRICRLDYKKVSEALTSFRMFNDVLTPLTIALSPMKIKRGFLAKYCYDLSG